MNIERHDERSGHVRNKCFQVCTDTREGKPVEVRECDTDIDRLVPQSPLDITLRNRAAKANLEYLQLRQV